MEAPFNWDVNSQNHGTIFKHGMLILNPWKHLLIGMLILKTMEKSLNNWDANSEPLENCLRNEMSIL